MADTRGIDWIELALQVAVAAGGVVTAVKMYARALTKGVRAAPSQMIPPLTQRAGPARKATASAMSAGRPSRSGGGRAAIAAAE
ncbi:hypothetical protein [Streptosporangium sp. CA-115845]|uniref:hypothetical protein n=1 Tax=Streptosporangium sp. CA-115845 TaxID=3240071 RepID=UPI003D89CD2E